MAEVKPLDLKKILLKIVLIGESGVGKTSLLSRYVNDKFSKHYKYTIGADFLVKEVMFDNTVLVLQIWDTAGQERFQSLGVAFYRSANAYIIVYDETNTKSFDAVNLLREEALANCGTINPAKFPLLLLSNKSDLVQDSNYCLDSKLAKCGYDIATIKMLVYGYCRNIEKECGIVVPLEITIICEAYCGDINKGRLYANNKNMIFYQVSAKTGFNVNEAFMDIAKRAYQYHLEQNRQTKYYPLPLTPDVLKGNLKSDGKRKTNVCGC